jgi:hypothetical protein
MIKSPKLSSLVFGVAIICFFLPFVTLSCGGQRAMTFSGMQMAIGTSVDEPQLFGPPRKKPVEPNPLASLALLCAVLGVILGLTTTSVLSPAITGIAGALSLLLAKGRLDDQVLRQGQGMLQVNTETGYIIAVCLFLCVAAWNAYLSWVGYQQRQFATVGRVPQSAQDGPTGRVP